ncbi:response regulator transcription factor [Adlercreutzia sp. ZJ141]|uniref:response regulator transcription factor n=1 Tax=Adlercreutzia sp. ZJ141 TaxID=2709406 RepID=UPI0013EC7699|nr:helix-turn-helix transcriptional regulator [Adlercreutzia sp. ZJ141]
MKRERSNDCSLLVRVCLIGGMGLCWAFESCVSIVGETAIAKSDMAFSYYLVQSPGLVVVALIIMGSSILERFAVSRAAQTLLLVLSWASLLALCIAAESPVVTFVAIQVLSVTSMAINYLWFCEIGKISTRFAKQCTLGTAVVYGLFGCFGNILVSIDAAIVAALLLVLSYCAYLCVSRFSKAIQGDDSLVPAMSFTWSWQVIVGIVVFVVCVSYLQVVEFKPYAETLDLWLVVSHIATVGLVATLVYVVKGSEYTLTIRILSTIVLISLFEACVQQSLSQFSMVCAAVVFNTFTFISFVALAQLTYFSGAKKSLVVGAYQLIMIGSVLLGHFLGMLPVEFRTLSALALESLLVISALWFLTEDRVFRFFYGIPASLLVDSKDGETHGSIEKSADCSSEAEAQRTIGMLDIASREISEEFGLTKRESDVLSLISKGRSSTYIAEQLVVSQNTVRSHVAHIYTKCGVHSRQEIITMVNSRAFGRRPNADAVSDEQS